MEGFLNLPVLEDSTKAQDFEVYQKTKGTKRIDPKALFTLYLILKRSIAETVPDKATVHTRNATFGTISAPEQDYFAQFSEHVIPAT